MTVIIPKKQLVFLYIGYLAVAAAAFMVMVLVYWSLKPYQPLDVKVQPIPVIPGVVTPGGNVLIDFQYCKNVDGIDSTSKKLEGDVAVVELPSGKSVLEKGCGEYNVPIPIPKNVQPGQYKITFDVTYDVNPIRTVEVKFETEKFTITK